MHYPWQILSELTMCDYSLSSPSGLWNGWPPLSALVWDELSSPFLPSGVTQLGTGKSSAGLCCAGDNSLFFLALWVLNSGLCTWEAGILLLEPCPQPFCCSCFLFFVFFFILFYYSYVHTRLGSFLPPAPTPSLVAVFWRVTFCVFAAPLPNPAVGLDHAFPIYIPT
jgi:hypothetical protein